MQGDALYDVLHIVFKYSSAKDLCTIATVNKSWCELVYREQFRRNYIQQLCLPYELGQSVDIVDRVVVNPCASVLIYDTKFEKSIAMHNEISKLDESILKDFKNKLPGKIIVIKLLKYFTMEDVENNFMQGQRSLELTGNCGSILGLFFPKSALQLHVDVATLCYHPISSDSSRIQYVRRLCEKLGLIRRPWENLPSTHILFASSVHGFNIAETFISSSVFQSRDSVWFGGLAENLMATDCSLKICQNRDAKIELLVLRLSGPNLKSWTTIIRKGSTLQEVERKLYKLKSEVTPRKYNMGLVYAPTCNQLGYCSNHKPCYNSVEIMRNVNRVFPGIPFSGFFFDKCQAIQMQEITRGDMPMIESKEIKCFPTS